jgi:hypothetical protein
MNAVSVITIAITAAWLLILTVALLLCIRQLGAMTVRMQLLAVGGGANRHGSSIGFRVSDDLVRLEPEIGNGRRVVLLTSTTCTTCAELLAEFAAGHRPASLHLPDELVALLPGDSKDGAHQAAVAAFEGRARVVVDPAATVLARGLKMANVPSALLVENGLITGNLLFVEGVEQIDRLVGGLESPIDAKQVAATKESVAV